MLLKRAWCVIWVRLNAYEQLRGCLKVAFPGDVCSVAGGGDFFRKRLSAIKKRGLSDICKGMLLIEKHKLNYSKVVQ